MKTEFNVGDKVAWESSSGLLTGTVTSITPLGVLNLKLDKKRNDRWSISANANKCKKATVVDVTSKSTKKGFVTTSTVEHPKTIFYTPVMSEENNPHPKYVVKFTRDEFTVLSYNLYKARAQEIGVELEEQ